jgi:hypothetical protein
MPEDGTVRTCIDIFAAARLQALLVLQVTASHFQPDRFTRARMPVTPKQRLHQTSTPYTLPTVCAQFQPVSSTSMTVNITADEKKQPGIGGLWRRLCLLRLHAVRARSSNKNFGALPLPFVV